MVIPVALGLLDGNGQELETKLAGETVAKSGTRVLLADAAETTFTFEDVASPPVPSLFRGFSAPIKLSGISSERARFLAEHDTDPFVRWEVRATICDARAARHDSRRGIAAKPKRSTPA